MRRAIITEGRDTHHDPRHVERVVAGILKRATFNPLAHAGAVVVVAAVVGGQEALLPLVVTTDAGNNNN